MPIKNGTVFCINHPTVAMTRNRGFNAITTFERTPTGFEFNPGMGMPIIAYYCNECGYVETYAAQKTQFWHDIAGAVDPVTNYKLFESTIRNALDALDGPKAIEQNVRLVHDGRIFEADIIMRTPEAAYIFEVKSRPFRETMETAARQVRRAVKLVEQTLERPMPVIPILVVPDGSFEYEEVDGVKVLRFDLNALRFTNAEILNHSPLRSHATSTT
jgi:Holliday junction resolvase-like predicted endonuclease